jgi:KipI family sensor histidine kinase inhibitor
MPEWVPLGDRAIRFARPKVAAKGLLRELRSWPGVIDVVIAREDVAVYFADEPRIDEARLRALDALPTFDMTGRVVLLRARYDGIDLDEVARATGLSRDEVIEIHSGASYLVEVMGFAPGFAYLTGLDARLQIARRATPRTRVPAGSIGIAGEYTGIYPFDSPGGWHLIGSVDVPLFDQNGAALQLGDQVRFLP